MTSATTTNPARGTRGGNPGVAGAARSAARPAAAEPLDRQLEQIEGFLHGLDGSAEGAARSASDLRRRLAAGRLHVAVLGQFKRGKSSLLNALLGEELLPTGVVPVTAVPTFLRHGDSLALRVSYADGRNAEYQAAESIEALRSSLTTLVTETGNPENRLGYPRRRCSCLRPCWRTGSC